MQRRRLIVFSNVKLHLFSYEFLYPFKLPRIEIDSSNWFEFASESVSLYLTSGMMTLITTKIITAIAIIMETITEMVLASLSCVGICQPPRSSTLISSDSTGEKNLLDPRFFVLGGAKRAGDGNAKVGLHDATLAYGNHR